MDTMLTSATNDSLNSSSSSSTASWTSMDGSENAVTASETLENAEYYSEAFVQNGIFLSGIVFNTINLWILRVINVGENYRVGLLALTVSDLCACVFGVAQLTVEGVYFRSVLPYGYWHEAALAVYLLYYIFLLFMCTSSVYVILIAIVRTHTLRRPIRSLRLFTPKTLKRVCMCIFFVNTLLFLPTALFGIWQSCFNDKDIPKCQTFFKRFPDADKLKYYFYCLSVLFGPCVIITNTACLFIMKRALKQGQHTAKQHLNRRPTSIYNMVRRHSKITRTLAVILVLDTVWILPTCVQFVGLLFATEDTLLKGQNPVYKSFDLFAEILLSLRPTYTIFAFLATNTHFRRKFYQTFCCCCYDSQQSSPSASDKFATPSATRRAGETSATTTPNGAILRRHKTIQSTTPAQLHTNDVTKVQKQLSWRPDIEQQLQKDNNAEHQDVGDDSTSEQLCDSIENLPSAGDTLDSGERQPSGGGTLDSNEH